MAKRYYCPYGCGASYSRLSDLNRRHIPKVHGNQPLPKTPIERAHNLRVNVYQGQEDDPFVSQGQVVNSAPPTTSETFHLLTGSMPVTPLSSIPTDTAETSTPLELMRPMPTPESVYHQKQSMAPMTENLPATLTLTQAPTTQKEATQKREATAVSPVPAAAVAATTPAPTAAQRQQSQMISQLLEKVQELQTNLDTVMAKQELSRIEANSLRSQLEVERSARQALDQQLLEEREHTEKIMMTLRRARLLHSDKKGSV